jgi:iron complex transport system ATP-binding protein
VPAIDPVTPALEAREVSFRYAGPPVLDGVSLHVAAGEMLGVLGPNGSGKSTLLRLLSGVLRPERGEIRLHGRPLAAYRRAELGRALAVVPQDTVIAFPFSVAEVALMGRAPYRRGFAFESAQDVAVAHTAMRRTGVSELAARSIHELSGGERQRVVLARALAQEAHVLLLDEPAAHLDLRHQVELYELLRELLAEGAAVVSVLHDLNFAALYCDRVTLLKGGRLVATGAPAEVITRAAVREVYEADAHVETNPYTRTVSVLPRRRLTRD